MAQRATARVLDSLPPAVIPAVLRPPAPRLVRWQGGYVTYGLTREVPRYLHLLQHGLPTRGLVLGLNETRDGRRVEAAFQLCFRGTSGEVRVESLFESIDLDLVAYENRRGALKPWWDLRLKRGSTVTVLLDPTSTDWVVYEALFVDEAAAVAHE